MVAAVRDNPLLVLDDVEAHEVAAAVAALVDDGRRVIVTAAADVGSLAAVRDVLPAGVGDRVVDALPTLAPADLHRLRGLLATSTPRAPGAGHASSCPTSRVPGRRRRGAAVRASPRAPQLPGTELIAPLLVDLDDRAPRGRHGHRRSACSARSPRSAPGREPWIWELLGDLVHGRRRSAFDSLVQSTAQALTTIDDGRGNPPVRVAGPLPEDAIDILVAYLEFREAGGRTRGTFRSAVQRDVEPVLRLLRVGDRAARDGGRAAVVLTHFELGERLVAVDTDCAELDLPTPQNPDELDDAVAGPHRHRRRRPLRRGAAPRRAVPAPGSPVAVPDVAAAEQLALAVLDFAENGSPRRRPSGWTTWRLPRRARAAARHAPPSTRVPWPPCGTRRRRVRRGGRRPRRAHLAQRDERRTAALLTELGSPSLAQAWMPREDGTAVRSGPGLVLVVGRAARRAAAARTGRTWSWCSTPAASASTAPAGGRRTADGGRGGARSAQRWHDPARPAPPGVRAGDPWPVHRGSGAGRPAHGGSALRADAARRGGAGGRLTAPPRGTSVGTVTENRTDDHPVSRFGHVEPDDLPDDLRVRIEAIAEKSGFVPNVFRALARRPAELRAFLDYHDAVMEREGGLSQAERELVVVATSGANHCTYCVVAHGAILRIRARDREIADRVATNPWTAPLSPRWRAIVDLALVLATDPARLTAEHLGAARAAGLDDDEIWDVGAVTALFALSNRMAHLTALQPNPEFFLMGRTSRS